MANKYSAGAARYNEVEELQDEFKSHLKMNNDPEGLRLLSKLNAAWARYTAEYSGDVKKPNLAGTFAGLLSGADGKYIDIYVDRSANVPLWVSMQARQGFSSMQAWNVSSLDQDGNDAGINGEFDSKRAALSFAKSNAKKYAAAHPDVEVGVLVEGNIIDPEW